MKVTCSNLPPEAVAELRTMEHDDIGVRTRCEGRTRRPISFWLTVIQEILARAGTEVFEYSLIRDLGASVWFMSSLHARGFVAKVGVTDTGRTKWRLTEKAVQLVTTDNNGGGGDMTNGLIRRPLRSRVCYACGQDIVEVRHGPNDTGNEHPMYACDYCYNQLSLWFPDRPDCIAFARAAQQALKAQDEWGIADLRSKGALL